MVGKHENMLNLTGSWGNEKEDNEIQCVRVRLQSFVCMRCCRRRMCSFAPCWWLRGRGDRNG